MSSRTPLSPLKGRTPPAFGANNLHPGLYKLRCSAGGSSLQAIKECGRVYSFALAPPSGSCDSMSSRTPLSPLKGRTPPAFSANNLHPGLYKLRCSTGGVSLQGIKGCGRVYSFAPAPPSGSCDSMSSRTPLSPLKGRTPPAFGANNLHPDFCRLSCWGGASPTRELAPANVGVGRLQGIKRAREGISFAVARPSSSPAMPAGRTGRFADYFIHVSNHTRSATALVLNICCFSFFRPLRS